MPILAAWQLRPLPLRPSALRRLRPSIRTSTGTSGPSAKARPSGRAAGASMRASSSRVAFLATRRCSGPLAFVVSLAGSRHGRRPDPGVCRRVACTLRGGHRPLSADCSRCSSRCSSCSRSATSRSRSAPDSSSALPPTCSGEACHSRSVLLGSAELVVLDRPGHRARRRRGSQALDSSTGPSTSRRWEPSLPRTTSSRRRISASSTVSRFRSPRVSCHRRSSSTSRSRRSAS